MEKKIVIMAMVLLLIISGCIISSNKFVGTWKESLGAMGDEYFTFNDDGTGVLQSSVVGTSAFRYNATDTTISFETIGNTNGLARISVAEYNFVNDKIVVLNFRSGVSRTLIKQ